MISSKSKWIGSWLCQRKQKVVLDGYSSEESSVISGVPQGRYWVLWCFCSTLAALNLISQVCDQSTSVLRSCCSCWWSCLVSMVLYSRQSSAKSFILVCGDILSAMSFTSSGYLFSQPSTSSDYLFSQPFTSSDYLFSQPFTSSDYLFSQPLKR
jgi:hypothetical protein